MDSKEAKELLKEQFGFIYGRVQNKNTKEVFTLHGISDMRMSDEETDEIAVMVTDAKLNKYIYTLTYFCNNFTSAIDNVSADVTLVTKAITANGEYNPKDDKADGYSKVTVNVPQEGIVFNSKLYKKAVGASNVYMLVVPTGCTAYISFTITGDSGTDTSEQLDLTTNDNLICFMDDRINSAKDYTLSINSTIYRKADIEVVTV